jgi:hypothetical protein
VELLDCIWQYASLARLITNRRATCGQAEHLKVWCSNPGIVGMSARTTSLNCISAPHAAHCIARPSASPRGASGGQARPRTARATRCERAQNAPGSP